MDEHNPTDTCIVHILKKLFGRHTALEEPARSLILVFCHERISRAIRCYDMRM